MRTCQVAGPEWLRSLFLKGGPQVGRSYSSVQRDFWTCSVEILATVVFPSPAGDMLTSFTFSLLICGVFDKFLKIDE